jgi:enoyl-[acyl-carrier protein] reductase I
MQGKRGLIMGVANDHSIAWGIAQACCGAGRGARLHLPGRGALARCRPLANRSGSKIVLPCDVEDIETVDACSTS